jgi:glutamyl-tRNA synthetase
VQQDFVIVRADGFPLYNLAAVVDDHEMQMTLVARARDHIGNTPLQLLLYRALGWDPPEFAHLPLMQSQKGEKLSKRHAAVSVQEYKDKGYTPNAVLNYLVRFGWSLGDKEIFSRQELIDSFDWERVNKSDGKFDEKKFADVAFEHLKQPELTSTEDYVLWVKPFLAARGLAQVDDAMLRLAIPTIRERAHTLVEAADALDYYFREPPQLDDKAVSKFLTPESKPRLAALAAVFEAQPDWAPQPLEAAFRTWVESQGLQLKDVAQPMRVALTGRSASPALFDVLHVLGRERSLGRLKRAAG